MTVVVPVYNGERHLRESLDSILAQTYAPLEVIVMDDASTDGSAAVAEAYGAPVAVHRQPANRGIYANTNDAIALARGDLVAVYHADDVYEPTMIEREVDHLRRHPELGAVFTKDVFVDADGREIGRLTLPPELSGGRPLDYAAVVNGLLRSMNAFLRCPSSMVRADVYREVGPYRQELFRNTSDLDMWLRIARAHPVAVVDEHLFRYRRDPTSSSLRYHRLRTVPDRFFPIMDHHLREGAAAVATPDALAAFEAHRAEDQLMQAVSQYILGDLAAAHTALGAVRVRRLAGSPRVQRVRLLVLYAMMSALVRVRRIGAVADLLYRRRYGKA
ncbi:MAG TPA: glycosyltransferase [Candidatus Dormibacteraeota bacterium]|nr:glycosyltransferase [Candidatus Dormibacteraeota bacterium]